MDSPRFARFLAGAILIGLTSVTLAQGPPGRDRDNPPPGHGGVPPGQARKYGDDNRRGPATQSRSNDFHFRQEDRNRFYSHYQRDADRWRGRKRPAFVPGQRIATTYAIRPVPRGYWEGVAPPPPPGYQYGYYDGYVVAYSPTTRVIADVLDLVNAANNR